MNEELDHEIRLGVQDLMDGAPPPPGWGQVDEARVRRLRRKHVGRGVVGLVAVLAVVGLVGRATSDDATVVAGPGQSDDPCGTYWVAVHTLFDSSVSGRASYAMALNVEQAAFLAESGDVPDRVAAAIGGDAADLAARVEASPNPGLGTVEITAWAHDPREVEELADAFAEGVLTSVVDIQQRENDRERSVLEAKVAQVQSMIASATGEDERRVLLEDLQKQQIRLEELEQRAAAGSNLYSMGSSEAFQVTGPQLEQLMADAESWRQNYPRSQNPSSRVLGPMSQADDEEDDDGC
jgi:hypothetical protein